MLVFSYVFAIRLIDHDDNDDDDDEEGPTTAATAATLSAVAPHSGVDLCDMSIVCDDNDNDSAGRNENENEMPQRPAKVHVE
jgi:hypothetical protein